MRTKQNREVVRKYTTEKDGFINVPTLQPEHYAVSEMKAPEGMEILVIKFNGEQIGYFKTDDSGRITINGLAEGTYIVKETKRQKASRLTAKLEK